MEKYRALFKLCRQAVMSQRHLSVTPITYKAATATDPIQQLFVDKVRSYAEKSKASGGKLVDATPEIEAKYNAEIDRVQRTFGAVAGEDFTKFPTFSFQDTDLEPVAVTVDAKAVEELVAEEVLVEDEETMDRDLY